MRYKKKKREKNLFLWSARIPQILQSCDILLRIFQGCIFFPYPPSPPPGGGMISKHLGRVFKKRGGKEEKKEKKGKRKGKWEV